MEVERESLKLRLSNELTETARLVSMEAHKRNESYMADTVDHVTASSSSSSSSMEVFIIAFPGAWGVNDWYRDDLFGEIDVNCSLFPSLRRIGENRLAKVNAAFLHRFQDLLNNSCLQAEVDIAVNDDQKILFIGYSSGGAIASLATLWILDEYVKKCKISFPIGCVTFGSPLIGDRTLSHAVRREKWAGHFTHFVMEHDVVPRIMLAPKISIQEHLPNILKYFQQRVNPTTHKSYKLPKFLHKSTPRRAIDQDPSIEDEEGVDFFENVMINASTIASHVAFNLMEPTNSLMEKLSADFVKVSPYRPSGYYVFCISPFQQFRVENPDAVLQLLFYLLQLTDESQNLTDFSVKSITESLSYEDVQSENLVNLNVLYNQLLTPNGTASDAVRTSNQAVFNLSTSARCCLMTAEEAEKRKKKNEELIDTSMRKYATEEMKKEKDRTKLKIIEDLLDELRKYKTKHAERENNYYDAFKLQDDHEDFLVNVDRLKLAKIFDEIMEMVDGII